VNGLSGYHNGEREVTGSEQEKEEQSEQL